MARRDMQPASQGRPLATYATAAVMTPAAVAQLALQQNGRLFSQLRSLSSRPSLLMVASIMLRHRTCCASSSMHTGAMQRTK